MKQNRIKQAEIILKTAKGVILMWMEHCWIPCMYGKVQAKNI